MRRTIVAVLPVSAAPVLALGFRVGPNTSPAPAPESRAGSAVDRSECITE